MKNFIIGFVLGILLVGIISYFTFIPDTKDTAYKAGYNEGNTKGTLDGRIAGIEEGIKQTVQKYQHEKDSIATAEKIKQETQRALAEAKRSKVKPIQNWHVINNQIAEPIRD